MRVSVPTIPALAIPTPPIAITPALLSQAVDRLVSFLSPGNVTVITGAGVSVDSGIRAYRGKDGRYMNPNYKPILYHNLMDPSATGVLYRKRYWLRSFIGYPSVRDSLPNPTHFGLAALQHAGVVNRIITQNVDGLHHKAFSNPRITELHGTLHRVRCINGHLVDREVFQTWLTETNPSWVSFADGKAEFRTNPDGDVDIEHLGISYDDFKVPECPTCRSDVQKPDLIFFGESIPEDLKARSFEDIDAADRVLLIGTTLATYSAFRLLKRATEAHKPVLQLNIGPSRADGVPGVEKIDGIPSGMIIRDVVRGLLGTRATYDPVVAQMLLSGVVKPPPSDEGVTH